MTASVQGLVSVIMPTYNHARYLGEAVGSVLRQEYSELELIVVDNYSADDTESVVAAIKDPRLIYRKFSNNGIIAASRNYGIRLSKGEYVAFLDSDDVWLPGKLDKQVAALKMPDRPLMTYGRFQMFDGRTASMRVFPGADRCVSGSIFDALYRGHFIACSGVVVRKSALDAAGGFDERPDMLAIEDMDLWLRIALSGAVRCASQDPLFLYRVHPGSMSGGYMKRYRRALRLLHKFSREAGVVSYAAAVGALSLSVAKQMAFGAHGPMASDGGEAV